MLQSSPLKEISSRDLGRQGVVKQTGRKLCFIDYDLFTTALSRVPTITTLLVRILNHLDFWRTLTVQGYQVRQAYQHTLVSLYRIGVDLLLQNRCKSLVLKRRFKQGETLGSELANSLLFPK